MVCIYETMEIAREKLTKTGQKSITIGRAIGILRYLDPIPLPYGCTVSEFLYLMKDRGLVRIAKTMEESTHLTRVFI